MAYVGTPIDTNNQFQSLQGKRFSGDASTTAFTLDIAPTSVFDIEVFVENVRQDPNSAYTLSGTTLTFTGAPASGTNNIYVVHQAKAVGTINATTSSIAADAITEALIADDAVESEHLNNNIISGQTALAAEPADTDEFLISDAGTIKRIDYSLIKAGYSFFAAKESSNQEIGNATQVKVTFESELFDSNSKYDTSNSRYTPAVAGKYLITCGLSFTGSGDNNYIIIYVYKNGSEYTKSINRSPGTPDNGVTLTSLVELDDNDYIEIYAKQNTGSTQQVTSGSSDRTTFFGGVKVD